EDRRLMTVAYTVQQIGTLGGADSHATAINASGEGGGDADLATASTYHAFSFTNGTLTDLGTVSGSGNSQATGINANGDIVGGGATPFLYHAGAFTDLSTVGGATGFILTATGINSSGQVTGTIEANGKARVYLFDGTNVTLLGSDSDITD